MRSLRAAPSPGSDPCLSFCRAESACLSVRCADDARKRAAGAAWTLAYMLRLDASPFLQRCCELLNVTWRVAATVILSAWISAAVGEPLTAPAMWALKR